MALSLEGTKIISALLITSLSWVFGYLPRFLSRKFRYTYSMDVKDPSFDPCCRQNVIMAFVLNFGGGVLFANCFLHWMPEVENVVANSDYSDIVLPLAPTTMCAGFLFSCVLEEALHHVVLLRCDFGAKSKEPDVAAQQQKDPESKKDEFKRYDETRMVELGINGDPPCVGDADVADGICNDICEDDEKSVIRTFFVVAALSFHSVISGLTLALEAEAKGVWMNFSAIAMHKFVIAFSMGAELLTATKSSMNYLVSITVFSLSPSVGMAVGLGILGGKQDTGLEDSLALNLTEAVAAGVVIYVIFYEIFPKGRMCGTAVQHVAAIIIGFLAFLPSLVLFKH